MFFEVDAGSLFKMGLLWLEFSLLSGELFHSQHRESAGRGFVEGMWKGVEWFFIVLAGILVVVAVIWGVGMMSNALNAN